jgi:VIT1/CCC1 family predicted Fe2+/Mn2+ transporter
LSDDASDLSGQTSARRRLEELNNDLRVALPGVQVLFGFLLTLPFSSRFSVLNAGAERVSYLVAFIAAAISSVFLIAPSALHRFYHELDDPGGLVPLFRVSAQLAVAGMLCLAISMGAVVFLVIDVFYRRSAAALVTALIAALIAWFWFGYPVSRRFSDRA